MSEYDGYDGDDELSRLLAGDDDTLFNEIERRRKEKTRRRGSSRIPSAAGRDVTGNVRPRQAPPSGNLSAVERALGSTIAFGREAYEHPGQTLAGLVEAPLQSAERTFLRPVEGTPAPGYGKSGPRPGQLPPGTIRTKANSPSAISQKEFGEAAVQTLANASAPVLGPAAGKLVGKVASPAVAKLAGRVATAAPLGAAYSPDDPLAGALAMPMMGELLHGAIKGTAGAVKRTAQAAGNLELQNRAGVVGRAGQGDPFSRPRVMGTKVRGPQGETRLTEPVPVATPPTPRAIDPERVQGTSALLLSKLHDPNEGGFTIDPVTGEAPTSGYAVGAGTTLKRELIGDLATLKPEEIAGFLDAQRDLPPGIALGGWTHEGRAVIEPVHVFADPKAAYAAAFDRGEYGLGDVAKYRQQQDGFIPVEPPTPLGASPDPTAAFKAIEADEKATGWQKPKTFSIPATVLVDTKAAVAKGVKPAVTTELSTKNLAEQAQGLDALGTKHADPLVDEMAWARFMRDATGSRTIPEAPSTVLNYVRDPELAAKRVRIGEGLNESQVTAARAGLETARKFQQLIETKRFTRTLTAKAFGWSFLSRMMSAYPHEAAFIQVAEKLDPYIVKAMDGKLTAKEVDALLGPEYKAKTSAGHTVSKRAGRGLVDEWLPTGAGVAGAEAKQNVNAFIGQFLWRMQEKLPDGRTRLQALHEVMTDPSLPSQVQRRQAVALGHKAGIDSKIVSFTQLMLGRDDVMVIDRVQVNNFWDTAAKHGVENGYDNLRLANIFEGAQGLAVYEAIERSLGSRVADIYARAGRDAAEASLGRYHWETWVGASAQDVGHQSIEALLRDASGELRPYANVVATQGKYSTYHAGAFQGFVDGHRVQGLTTSDGTRYALSRAQYDKIIETSRQITPKGFELNPATTSPQYAEASRQPFYLRPDYPTAARDALIRELGIQLDAVKSPERITERGRVVSEPGATGSPDVGGSELARGAGREAEARRLTLGARASAHVGPSVTAQQFVDERLATINQILSSKQIPEVRPVGEPKAYRPLDAESEARLLAERDRLAAYQAQYHPTPEPRPQQAPVPQDLPANQPVRRIPAPEPNEPYREMSELGTARFQNMMDLAETPEQFGAMARLFGGLKNREGALKLTGEPELPIDAKLRELKERMARGEKLPPREPLPEVVDAEKTVAFVQFANEMREHEKDLRGMKQLLVPKMTDDLVDAWWSGDATQIASAYFEAAKGNEAKALKMMEEHRLYMIRTAVGGVEIATGKVLPKQVSMLGLRVAGAMKALAGDELESSASYKTSNFKHEYERGFEDAYYGTMASRVEPNEPQTIRQEGIALGQRFGPERPADYDALVQRFTEQLGRPLRKSETVNLVNDPKTGKLALVLHNDGADWATLKTTDELRPRLKNRAGYLDLTGKPHEPERIEGAAVRTPDGKVFRGALHVDAVDEAYKAKAISGEDYNHYFSRPRYQDPRGVEDGFVTSTGRFVDRVEAGRIAGFPNDYELDALDGTPEGAPQTLDELADRLNKPRLKNRPGFLSLGGRPPQLPNRPEGTGTPYKAKVDVTEDPEGRALANIAKLNLSPEAEAKVRDAYARLDLSKKTVTHEETREVANELGLDPRRLLDKEGRLSGAELLAVRDVISSNAQRIVELSNQTTNPSLGIGDKERLLGEINQLTGENDQFLRRYTKQREQAGRDLNALKIIARNTLDAPTWLLQAERLKGLPLTQDEHVLISKLAADKDREGLIKAVSGMRKSSTLDKAVSLWKAGLLTSLGTHEANLAGNAAMAVTESVKDVPAAMVDALLSLARGTERTKAPSVRGLVVEPVRGLVGPGFRAAKRVIRYGADPSELAKWDFRRTNYGDGPAGRIAQAYTDAVFNSLGAEDQLFRSSAIGRSLEEQARLLAKGDKTLLKQLRKSPTPEMMVQAIADGEVATFQNPNLANTAVAAARRGLRQAGKAGEVAEAASQVVAPFVKTPSNIVARTIEYSPPGLAYNSGKLVKALVKGISSPDQKKLAEAMGRGIVGSSTLFLLGFMLAREGKATGSAPKTPNERSEWDLEGKIPNGVQVGGSWRTFSRMGPPGLVIATGAQAYQAFTENETTAGKIFGALYAPVRAGLDQSFLQGVSGTLDALNDPTRAGEKFVESTAGSVIPSGVAQAARAMDPYARESRGITASVQARIPGLREKLPTRLNAFGKPLKEGTTLSDLFDPSRPREASKDPLILALEKANATVGFPSRIVTDKGERRRLSDEEYRQLLLDVGPKTEQSLRELYEAGLFTDARETPEDKRDAIAARISKVRSGAQHRRRERQAARTP